MPKKSKPKKINISEKVRWEQILKSVSKSEVPVEVLKSMTVNLIDGEAVHIDIRVLIANGEDPTDIEELINDRLAALDDYIKDIDFFICIDSVVKNVQPVTEQLLRDL